MSECLRVSEKSVFETDNRLASNSSTYQAEWAKNGKAFDVRQAELHQTQHDDDEIETAPLVLEVLVKTEGDEFERCLDGKNAREYLSSNATPVNI